MITSTMGNIPVISCDGFQQRRHKYKESSDKSSLGYQMKLSIPLKNIMLATGSQFDPSSSPEWAVNIKGMQKAGTAKGLTPKF